MACTTNDRVCVCVCVCVCVKERRKIEPTVWGKKVPIALDGIRTCISGIRAHSASDCTTTAGTPRVSRMKHFRHSPFSSMCVCVCVCVCVWLILFFFPWLLTLTFCHMVWISPCLARIRVLSLGWALITLYKEGRRSLHTQSILYFNMCKGPSQKFADTQWNEQNSFGKVGVFENIAF